MNEQQMRSWLVKEWRGYKAELYSNNLGGYTTFDNFIDYLEQQEKKGESEWRPTPSEKVFYILGNGAIESMPAEFCGGYVKIGNCYRTREEAEAAALRVKAAYKGV